MAIAVPISFSVGSRLVIITIDYSILYICLTRPSSTVTNQPSIMYTDRINPDLPEGRLLVSSRGIELKDPTLPISPIPLEEKAERLVEYLEQQNFEPKTVMRMRRTYVWIKAQGGNHSIKLSNQLLKEHPKEMISLTRWVLFDYYDMLPSRKRINRSPYSELSTYYREIIDNGMRAGQKTGIRDLTISVEASMTTSFFSHLMKIKIDHLSHLTEMHVRDYTRAGHCGPMILYRISVFLRRYSQTYNDTVVVSILHFFPKEKLVRKVYQAITPEERRTLETFILSQECPLSKRDRAIVMLLFYLGMRSNDVRKLRLKDIDWTNSNIKFVQGKTIGEMTLPLRPVVGNALYDYIANERPKCNEDLLFLSYKTYAGKYRPCQINKITNNAYKAADIRSGKVRKGTHLLRHSLADEMINQGNDITMVTKTLGHLNSSTTLGYMSSNIEQLRSCALSIEPYPIHSKYISYEYE